MIVCHFLVNVGPWVRYNDMEELEQLANAPEPAAETGSDSPGTQPGSETGSPQEPTTPAQGEPGTGNGVQKGKERSNRSNAERGYRYRRNARLEHRITELENKLKEVESSDKPGSVYEANSLRDRIEDLQSSQADRDYEDFMESARSEVGDRNMSQFEQFTDRYGAYINQNEPDLLKISNRPYGKIVLYEWCKRMEDPALREQWETFTPYEKSQVLVKFYSQVNGIVNSKAKRSNAPAPASGRQADTAAATDDFGASLRDAVLRRTRR